MEADTLGSSPTYPERFRLQPPESSEPARTVSALELRRKLVHVLPGLIPFVMLFVYHEDPLPLWNLGVVLAVIAALTWVWYQRRHFAARIDERWGLTCLAYPLVPFLMLCLFPGRAELAGVVLVVLAFGDGAAALGGTTIGGRALPWNRKKTWAGLICFVLAAAPLATVAYWAEAKPAVAISQAALCAAAAAVVGAVAESWPARSLDNLRVAGGAAVGAVAVQAFFFGIV